MPMPSSSSSLSFWDDRYSSSDGCYAYGTEPNDFLVAALDRYYPMIDSPLANTTCDDNSDGNGDEENDNDEKDEKDDDNDDDNDVPRKGGAERGAVPAMRILCIAEGEGRNAVYLAERFGEGRGGRGRGRGAGVGVVEVTAVDSSSAGLLKARELAESRGIPLDSVLRTVHADLATFGDGDGDGDIFRIGRYDMVVSIFGHIHPPSARSDVHRRCVRALKPGGIMILEAYSKNQLGKNTGGPQHEDMLMSVDTLREDLGMMRTATGDDGVPLLDFELLRECDRDVREGVYHTGVGSVVQMVARKRTEVEGTKTGPAAASLGAESYKVDGLEHKASIRQDPELVEFVLPLPATKMTTTTTNKTIIPKPMPLLPITSFRTIRLCQSLRLRHTDIFICSYPKSGTTWTQHIVLSLLMKAMENDNNDDNDDNDTATTTTTTTSTGKKQARTSSLPPYNHVSDYAPFYEVDQHWECDDNGDAGEFSGHLIGPIRANHDRLGRRVFNTHLRWEMLPKSEATKRDNKGKGRNEDGGYGNSNQNGGKKVITPTFGNNIDAGGAKFIYLIRSPLDACVSFYHHLSNQKEGTYEGTFDDFFRDWIAGSIAFGSWIDHVHSYVPALATASTTKTTSAAATIEDPGNAKCGTRCEDLISERCADSGGDDGGDDGGDGTTIGSSDELQRQRGRRHCHNNKTKKKKKKKNVLLITYEEMLSNLRGVVLTLANFLDVPITDRQVTEELLPTFTFHHMRLNLDKFQPRSVTWKGKKDDIKDGGGGDETFCFLRKGMSGDSLSVTTHEQRMEWREIVNKSGLIDALKFAFSEVGDDDDGGGDDDDDAEERAEVLEKILALIR